MKLFTSSKLLFNYYVSRLYSLPFKLFYPYFYHLSCLTLLSTIEVVLPLFVPYKLFCPFSFFCRDATTVGLIEVHETYPFGVDPKWHGTRSELPFLNSVKMKMSILLGVAQMNLGIILSYFTAKFFNDNLNI